MKVRKKPVVIDAVQWFPPGDSQHGRDTFEILPSPRGPRKTGRIYRVGQQYEFQTSLGPLRLTPGVWIVGSTVVHPDVFEDEYEPVEDDA